MFLKMLRIISVLGCAALLGAGSCEIGVGYDPELTPEQEELLCEMGRGQICDRLDVVLVDMCAGTAEVLERCDETCQRGQCVDGQVSEDEEVLDDEGELDAAQP